MSEEKSHSRFSASGSARWLACPGSIRLSEKAPPQKENEYALDGTKAHKAVEKLLRNRHKPLATADVIRREFGVQKLVYAEQVADYVSARMKKLFEPKLLIEAEAKLPVAEPDQKGTLDIAIVEEFGKLVIADFKHGTSVVHPEENSQLLYYALGIAHKYNYNFASVDLVILQPRARSEKHRVPRKWTTDIKTLYLWRRRFENGIKEAKRKDAPLNPGSHCYWCPAKDICPANRKSSKEYYD